MRLAGAIGLMLAAVAATPAAAETRDWPLAGFEKIQLDAAADVSVTTGGAFSVHADGDPELVAQLAPVVRGDTLYLDWRGRTPHITHGRLRIAVTMPRASGVGIKGAGRIGLDRAEGQTVVAAIEGAGAITIDAVKAPRTVIVLRGTGSITVAGRTDWLDARKSGVGAVEAKGLAARGGYLVSSGVGSVSARIDGPVTATLSGIGSIDIAGTPQCTVHRSGIGHVTCGG